jgi:hypothetical protein
MNKIRPIVFTMILCALATLFFSCGKKKQTSENIQEIDETKIDHSWYYFTNTNFEKIDLPQHAPRVLEKPWTESIRIASAASVPGTMQSDEYSAYAVVNRAGILACGESHAHLYCDTAIFSSDTADTLVFSDGKPVFYLYRSTFFNDASKPIVSSAVASAASSAAQAYTAQSSAGGASVSEARPFLVEFNPQGKVCYPLVSYSNLNLSDEDQITGYFWNGKTWACSAKKMLSDRVQFSYFYWEPLVSLTDLSPAITSNQLSFSPLTEQKYRDLNMPLLFRDAPAPLKALLASIPKDFCFYVTWRDNSGTSPLSYYQEGNDTSPINAHALIADKAGYSAALFEDGTTYLAQNNSDKKVTAFRLPRLPAGYTYSDLAIAGNTLYAAWEESNFYKTGRAGFLTVDIAGVLSKAE